MSKSLSEWSRGDGTSPRVIASAAWKGGDGKGTFARELAYLLDAVLVDFDWDNGCSSRHMGYRHERYTRFPLREAFEKGTTPRPILGRRKADLVPSYPAWQEDQPDRDDIASALERWAREWQRPVVVDTHPGGCEATYGALAAASVVVVPCVLVKDSLNALEGMVDELSDHRLLLTPNKVSSPPAWARKDFRRIAEKHGGFPTGPLVHEEKWLTKRRLNLAVSSEPVPQHARRFVASMDALVEAVISYE